MNKVIMITSLALGFMAISTDAFADSQSPFNSLNNQIGIAAIGTLFNYQEHINPGPSDIESGWMPGFDLHLRGTSQRLYGSFNFAYNQGDISYQGALMNGTPLDGTDSATTMRILGKAGYLFPVSSNMMFIPYIAGGWQQWKRHLLGPSGYKEKYSASLAGLGAKFQYAVNSKLALEANMNVLAILMGGMSPTGLPQTEGNNAQFKTTAQENISLDANYSILSNVSVFGGIKFTHFNYSGGSLQASYPYYAFEPSSSTNQFSLNLGLAYSF